jgi:hypothetical protein
MSVRQNVFRQSVFRQNVRVPIKLNPERIKWERVLPNFGLGDGVCVTGTVNDRYKNGNGKVVYHIESYI